MTVVEVNYKDSGSEDTDAYVMPLNSFKHLTLGPYLSEAFNKKGLVLNGIET